MTDREAMGLPWSFVSRTDGLLLAEAHRKLADREPEHLAAAA
ncbi:hypothetical protein RI578_42105 (plasmid) [Streptomyces sp. BB1-1-1]|nr:hypothetical protein [Streptomyces sp. BB1-1-1]WND32891.1 hypothetical protein RI578_00530 [Streptomyces sp. BB1-1-1]WND40040.1 hypothetical protein RI578_39875 [Streptomyces sp. BB1-1-1]WND40875.1 hypothetical protein RI578_42105 [Streptomyces sp. BB1-1-1]